MRAVGLLHAMCLTPSLRTCLVAGTGGGEPGKGSAGARLQHDDAKAMAKAKKSATLVRTEVVQNAPCHARERTLRCKPAAHVLSAPPSRVRSAVALSARLPARLPACPPGRLPLRPRKGVRQAHGHRAPASTPQRRGGARTVDTYRVDCRAPPCRARCLAPMLARVPRVLGAVSGGLQTVSRRDDEKARSLADAAPVGATWL